MAQNTLTTDQKFWAFSFAVSFIIEGHPQPEFWYLMETFKNLPPSNKSLVRRIFHKAFNRGGGNGNTTIREMYNKVILESGMGNQTTTGGICKR